MNLFRLVVFGLTVFLSFNCAAVDIGDTGISFDPPENLYLMSQEQIKIKYGRNAIPPKWAYSNSEQTVSIAISTSDISLSPDQLPEFMESMIEGYNTLIPNFVWLKREIKMSNNINWVHLELRSTEEHDVIHNHVYMTSYKGKLIAFNFNATKETYDKYKFVFKDSFNTIKLDK